MRQTVHANIAIVERDIRNRELLRFWLEDAGYGVNTFATVAEASEAFRRGSTLELMIVESCATGMDSISVDQPDAPRSHLRIIRLEDEFADHPHSSDAFSQLYTTKPVDLYAILVLVNECIQPSEAQDQALARASA
jgi:DNA-binding NtrC family response regulator